MIDAACSSQAVRSLDDETGEVLLTADAVPGVPIRITKYATYQTSRSIPVPELVERCRRTLDRAVRDGFDVLAAAQRANLDPVLGPRRRAGPAPAQSGAAAAGGPVESYQIAQASWRAEGWSPGERTDRAGL